ncbi:MAG: ABC transporter permease, partial [Pseudomonadota bacterium]
MIFAHNAVIVVVLHLFLPIPYGLVTLLSVPGLILLVLNGLWVSLVLALICARFRDVPQIIGSLVQISFFMTPIIWIPSVLGDRAWLAALNPFTHMLQIVRAPLMGEMPTLVNYGVVMGLLIVGWVLAVFLLARARHRVAFWI